LRSEADIEAAGPGLLSAIPDVAGLLTPTLEDNRLGPPPENINV